MKNDKKILIAFLLNFFFSIFEFFGGIITGSVAIFSDALHDLGDSVSIGASYFLERKSLRPADKKYTFGYARFSPLGAIFTTIILLFGSIFVAYNAILRLISPSPINYDKMIVFAIVGVIINLIATVFTKDSHSHNHSHHEHEHEHEHGHCHEENNDRSINRRAVNLHMLEDVLGWLCVLVGAVVMKFTNFWFLDPILSILIAVFIFINAIKNGLSLIELFLLKTPKKISVSHLEREISKINGVLAVLDIKVLPLDENKVFVALKIKAKKESQVLPCVKNLLENNKILESSIEIIE